MPPRGGGKEKRKVEGGIFPSTRKGRKKKDKAQKKKAEGGEKRNRVEHGATKGPVWEQKKKRRENRFPHILKKKGKEGEKKKGKRKEIGGGILF